MDSMFYKNTGRLQWLLQVSFWYDQQHPVINLFTGQTLNEIIHLHNKQPAKLKVCGDLGGSYPS